VSRSSVDLRLLTTFVAAPGSGRSSSLIARIEVDGEVEFAVHEHDFADPARAGRVAAGFLDRFSTAEAFADAARESGRWRDVTTASRFLSPYSDQIVEFDLGADLWSAADRLFLGVQS